MTDKHKNYQFKKEHSTNSICEALCYNGKTTYILWKQNKYTKWADYKESTLHQLIALKITLENGGSINHGITIMVAKLHFIWYQKLILN